MSQNDVSPLLSVSVLQGRIGTIAMSNPGCRNALSCELLTALDQQLVSFAEQRIAVVILGCDPLQGVWSAGHDITEVLAERDPVAHGKPLDRLLRRVRAYPGVVTAKVSGSVWGAAVDLVMSCDLVVADRSASFTMTPSNLGVPYTTSGLLRFMHNLPIHVLKEMFFCASPLDADRALQFGVINRLTSPEQLDDVALAMAVQIAAKAPLAVQAVKEQLRILEDLQPMPVEAMERIAELRRQACESSDLREGVEAFLERRPPVFTGAGA
ncbi:Methylmalonyl-CoA decarboxylase [compost metagenome]